MSRLFRDRYLRGEDGRVWDLATGEVLDEVPEREELLMPSPAGVIEVLDHGRDGEPRRIAVEARSAPQASALARRAAIDAVTRGYVPIAAHLYARVRDMLGDELRERTLMLLSTGARSRRDAQWQLVDAASRSPRPHVLVSLGGAAATQASVAREARAAYARGEAGTRAPRSPDIGEHLRRASRAGDFIARGRHAAAERLLRDVAGALERRGAIVEATHLRMALGRLLLERGRAAAAHALFEECAAAAQAAGAESVCGDARLWQAAARIDLGQLPAAEAVCRALLAVDCAGEVRARTPVVLARVLLWQGRIDEATDLTLSASESDPLWFAYGASIRIRTLIRAGRLFDAGIAAGELQAIASSSPLPLVHVIAATTQLRVSVASGDLAAAESRLAAALAAARRAHAPLRAARARVLWIELLHRMGRTRDAGRALARLARMSPALPPLLRRVVAERGRACDTATPMVAAASAPGMPEAAAALVQIAHDEDDDRQATGRVLEWVAARLRASRIDVASRDAGPVTMVMSEGGGAPTHLGPRTLDAGIAIGPEMCEAGHELGVPVRSGVRLVAALVARWPGDRACPATAVDLLSLAAAVCAPRIDAMLTAARDAAKAAVAIPDLVGVSDAIDHVRKAVARAASSPFAVLIDGESGVGKELVARALHHLSPRRERRFCDVNCAALPDDLFESELFGYARGAFTGAVADRRGLFEEADGGTLFLDELADLSPRAQAKLLRVIQQHEVRRVGESFSRPVDVRLVAAVNRDIQADARDGRFRQDLLYRLDVVRIRIPPLRERPEDIGVLAAHVWRGAAGRVGTRASLTHAVLAALSRYAWPGNVRELQNVMAQLAVAAPARGRVPLSLLPAAIAGSAASSPVRLSEARVAFERRFVEMALARAGGSRSRAARDLGLSRQGLLKLMARLGVGSGSVDGAVDRAEPGRRDRDPSAAARRAEPALDGGGAPRDPPSGADARAGAAVAQGAPAHDAERRP